MNVYEKQLINTMFKSDTANALFDGNKKPDDVKEIIEKGLEQFSKVSNQTQRYRFGNAQVNGQNTDRQLLLNIFFDRGYSNNPEAVISAAQCVDCSKAPFYPLWKRVCLIRLPMMTSEILGSEWIKLLGQMAISSKIYKMLKSAYAANVQFISAKVVPYLINHTSIEVIRAGNLAMSGVETVLKNKYRIVWNFFLIQCAFNAAVLIATFSLEARTHLVAYRERVNAGAVEGEAVPIHQQVRNGIRKVVERIFEEWGVEPAGLLPRPLSLLYRTVTGVDLLSFIWNFVWYAPVNSYRYLDDRYYESKECIVKGWDSVVGGFSTIATNYKRERLVISKKKASEVWVNLSNRHAPGVLLVPERVEYSTLSLFRVYSKIENSLIEKLTVASAVLVLSPLLIKSKEGLDLIFKAFVLYDLGSRIWKEFRRYPVEDLKKIQKEEGSVAAAVAVVSLGILTLLPLVPLVLTLKHSYKLKPTNSVAAV